MGTLDTREYIFPIMGGEKIEQQQNSGFLLKQIYGTAFSIGSGYFLTAAHVIASARENKYYGVGYRENNQWVSLFENSANDVETIDDFDIGIFHTKNIPAKSLKWHVDQLPMSQKVTATGYPYSFDLVDMAINIRTFTGYIVSSRKFTKLPPKPKIYELQFQCPRGLSGAPLLASMSELMVVGCVIGNHSTEMLVYSDKEIIDEPKQQTIVERYEALQLGIALQANSILDCYSQTLGCTLRTHLEKNQLLLI